MGTAHLSPEWALTDRWHGLEVGAEGTGISRPLSEQVNLLGALLGQAVREQAGPETLDRIEALRQLCKRADRTDDDALRQEAADLIAGLDDPDLAWLLRAFTAFFHLVNQAEQQEIIRINRERARQSTPEAPRAESIDQAVYRLHRAGHSLDDVLAFLGRLDVQPTLTAHPTEARRRSILYKQQRIAALLSDLSEGALTPAEADRTLTEIHNQIALLLATDEVRAERPSVYDEVEQGLYFMRNAIWESVPRIYENTRRALRTYYGEAPDVPTFLRYRSWIGSDRDGNPNVTPEVTRRTVLIQRRTVLELHLAELRELRRELSISDRLATVPDDLHASIEADAQDVQIDEDVLRPFRREPYRLKLTYMMTRVQRLLAQAQAALAGDGSLQPAAYRSRHFVADLELLRQCLEESGFEALVETSRIGRVLSQARSFGFHMSALDVRQHSRVHEATLSALLRVAGVHRDYPSLSESEKLALLGRELSNPRPLLPPNAELPDEAREMMETFATLREMVALEPEAVGSYIVSMTHAVSDLLEPILLAKEAGLWQLQAGEVQCNIDFVPLFETIEDLHDADNLINALFTHPIYQKQLAARGQFQEIMLGYSDSNKDGGYWMANWALHKAQARLGAVCRQHEIDFRLFHGRGGTVGRGGGRAGQAILAMPSAVHNGRIRFTEQGEVISFRYAVPDIAHRHLEQIVNAMLLATGGAEDAEDADYADLRSAPAGLMEDVAERAMAAYRGLIDDPGLWPWYTKSTPIEQISRLPIASRPVSRKSADEVDFEGLRAIPWVFAWTQTRYLVPGWYGLGQALGDVLEEDANRIDLMRRLYREWHFFYAVVNNAQREMARARFVIAARYAALPAPDDDATDGTDTDFHDRLADDFDRARKALLAITGQDELLDGTPVIQKSIRLRNPYTDVLNLLQIELIRRHRAATPDEKEALREALFLSINGIAAAMQSTG